MGHDKTFGSDGNVPYLDCDGSFMCAYICHSSSDCLLYVWKIYCTKFYLNKLVKKKGKNTCSNGINECKHQNFQYESLINFKDVQQY